MPAESLTIMPITQLSGVGVKMAQRLNKLGIQTVQDLLLHLPNRYEDRTTITPIAETQSGETTNVQGTVQSQQMLFGRRPMLLVKIADATGFATLRFFKIGRAHV